MTTDLHNQVRAYTEYFLHSVEPVEVREFLADPRAAHPPTRPLLRGPARGLAVAATSLLVAFGVWALYGVFGTGDAPATQPTQTSLLPSTTVAPSIWTDSLVCGSLPVTTTAVPEATGTELIIVDELGEVLRLNLGTGELSCVRPAPTVSEDVPPWVWGIPDGLIRPGSGTLIRTVSYGGGNWFIPDDFPLPIQELLVMHGGSYWPAQTPDTVWETDPSGPGTVRLLDLATGQPSPELALPSGGSVVGSDGAGLLLIKTPTAFMTFGPDGTTTTLWEGDDLLAVNADTVLALDCDPVNCALVAVDRSSGERTDLSPAPEMLTVSYTPGSGSDFTLSPFTLSPDGALLAAHYEPANPKAPHDGPFIFDLQTGQTLQLATGTWPVVSNVFSWSDDSSMLFWVDYDGVARLWRRDQPSDPTALADEILPPVRAVIVDS